MRILELFCGIGGLAAAIEGTGSMVTCAMDHDPSVLATYRHNHPEQQVARIDLSRVTPWQLAAIRADLWWLSPPCQPYSVRGNRLDLQDPRSASLLRIMNVLERLSAEKLPPAIAMENVPGFLQSQARERLTDILSARGYELKEQILCPTSLGVPMRRERYYLAASLQSLNAKQCRQMPQQIRPLRDFLDRRFYDDTPKELLLADDDLTRFAQGMSILDPSDQSAVATCFAASYGKTLVHSGAFLRCSQGVRHFAPLEIARLLGLPSGFSFPPGLPLRRQWHQLGNSLSVDAVRTVLSLLPGYLPR